MHFANYTPHVPSCPYSIRQHIRRPSPLLGRFNRTFPHALRNISPCAHASTAIIRIFDAFHPRAITRSQNLRKYATTYPLASPKLQAHRPTSPNILPAQRQLIPNIWYYSYTPCRPLMESSRTFGHRLLRFPSIPNTLIRISEDFYCAKLCTGTYSGIHPLPSIRPLHSHLLKLSISLGSIINHSPPSPPFSESIGACSPLHLFLFHSQFISFSFRFSLIFFLLSSCFMFRIFIFLFMSFRFLFPNIFEYLYAHVLVVSQ